MPKYQDVLHAQVPTTRRSRLPAIFAGVLLLLFAPLVYEGGLILLARWQTMSGTYSEPKTPILSALGDWSQTANLEGRSRVNRLMNSGPWKASLAVPIAVTWAVGIAVLFLRKVR